MIGLRKAFERGEISEETVFETAIEQFGAKHNDLWVTVRGERIIRNVRKAGQVGGSRLNAKSEDQDLVGYKKLKQFRREIDWDENFSDESDEEGDRLRDLLG